MGRGARAESVTCWPNRLGQMTSRSACESWRPTSARRRRRPRSPQCEPRAGAHAEPALHPCGGSRRACCANASGVEDRDEPAAQGRPGWRIGTSLRRKAVRGGGSRRACGAPVCPRQEGAAGARAGGLNTKRLTLALMQSHADLICRSQTSHTPPHTLRTSLASRPIRRPVSGNQSAGKPVINGSAFEGRPREPICRGRGAGVGERARRGRGREAERGAARGGHARGGGGGSREQD